jgi:hypothetical protein
MEKQSCLPLSAAPTTLPESTDGFLGFLESKLPLLYSHDLPPLCV